MRWRLRDLRERIVARFFVLMDERSAGRILKTLTFSHIPVRPRHPEVDAEARIGQQRSLSRIGDRRGCVRCLLDGCLWDRDVGARKPRYRAALHGVARWLRRSTDG